MDINKTEVRNRIFSIRKSLGLTMKEFGERMGNPVASDSIVSRWEKGISLPSNERLKKIAELGEMSVDELLGTKENQMTYNVNGINYSEKFITDEELAVVEAMRLQSTAINVFVNFETAQQAIDYAESFPNKKDHLTSYGEGESFVYVATGKTSVYARYN